MVDTHKRVRRSRNEDTPARKQSLLEAGAHYPTVQQALDVTGVPASTLSMWKRTDPDFYRAWELVRSPRAQNQDPDLTLDLDRPRRDTGTLVEFRQDVFGFPSNETQSAFGEAFDDHTNLQIIWLAPAGAGKDVTAMQAVAKAAADGEDRMGCLMENQRQAKKRIDSFLDPYFTSHEPYKRAPQIPDALVPKADFIAEWGPWKYDPKMRYPDGSKPPQTKWDSHNKWFVGRTTPQADPSLWAVGLKEAIAGSRVRLLVCSDLFTVENQRADKGRTDQLALINGTVDSRLDEAGRIIFLNHHVRRRGESNLVTLIDQYVGTARIVYRNGSYTQYANGTAIIRTPALEQNDEGIVVSYWPQRFPVHSKFILPDGQEVSTKDLSDAEHQQYSKMGARRIRGLLERRDRIGDAFELLYQQNPDVAGYGDFTQDILEACFDATRSFGEVKPNERLILGVDPARRGGAAWVLLGVSPDGVFTLVDYWTGDGLGFTGMRQKLIREPIEKWRPRDLVWEINFEEETPEHPEATEIINRFHVNYVPFRTHLNRSSGDFQVMSMLDDMHTHDIRFPARTTNDVLRLETLLQHFRNFEAVGYTERKRRGGRGSHIPDDACLAFWFAWQHGHSWLRSQRQRKARSSLTVSPAVRNAFKGMG